MNGYSCPKCGATSTSAATCHGRQMEGYAEVNGAALAASSGDTLLSSLLFGRLPAAQGSAS